MNVALIANTPEPQRLIETCARISYESQNYPFDPEVNSKFIRKLIENGHESPLEHASATFLIDGISRTCSHQIVRHRLASFSQRSGRYTESRCEFVNPFDREKQKAEWQICEEYFEKIRNSYSFMLESLDTSKEDARFILPQAEATSLYMTANMREWRHFLQLRLDKHAQWEIRFVACKVYELLHDLAPDVFDDLASEYAENFVAGG